MPTFINSTVLFCKDTKLNTVSVTTKEITPYLDSSSSLQKISSIVVFSTIIPSCQLQVLCAIDITTSVNVRFFEQYLKNATFEQLKKYQISNVENAEMVCGIQKWNFSDTFGDTSSDKGVPYYRIHKDYLVNNITSWLKYYNE